MECEICGSGEANRKIILDGNKLLVCAGCVNYGKELVDRPSSNPLKAPLQKTPLPEMAELASNYGAVVRKAREARGLTIKELAEKLFEKESVLHKIEQGKMQPENRLIEKLQKTLGVNLLENSE